MKKRGKSFKKDNLYFIIILIIVILSVFSVIYTIINGSAEEEGLSSLNPLSWLSKATTLLSKPQCSDGTDNDGDGKCDYLGCYMRRGKNKVWYSSDPDCASSDDNSEVCIPSLEICDGRDNDCLSFDPDCASSDDNSDEVCIPSLEICDGRDNDCDGTIDEELTEICGLTDIGICRYGTSTCLNGKWGSCIGEIKPSQEICDYLDNDCDGIIDENLVKQCGTSNVGECRYGISTCSYGVWGFCEGNIEPSNETCDSKDNDCDGTIDDGCSCTEGQTKQCGTDVGRCEFGLQTCSGGLWGACLNSIGPSTEICDGKDNDCNGAIDEVCGNKTI